MTVSLQLCNSLLHPELREAVQTFIKFDVESAGGRLRQEPSFRRQRVCSCMPRLPTRSWKPQMRHQQWQAFRHRPQFRQQGKKVLHLPRLPPPPPNATPAASPYAGLPTIFTVLGKLGLELKRQDFRTSHSLSPNHCGSSVRLSTNQTLNRSALRRLGIARRTVSFSENLRSQRAEPIM
jgi:hypothetical protein